MVVANKPETNRKGPETHGAERGAKPTLSLLSITDTTIEGVIYAPHCFFKDQQGA